MSPLAFVPAHFGDITDSHDPALSTAHHRILNLGQVFVGTGSFDGKASGSNVDDARRDVGVFALQGIDDERRTEPECCKTLGIDLYPQLPRGKRPAFRGSDTRYAL